MRSRLSFSGSVTDGAVSTQGNERIPEERQANKPTKPTVCVKLLGCVSLAVLHSLAHRIYMIIGDWRRVNLQGQTAPPPKKYIESEVLEIQFVFSAHLFCKQDCENIIK